MGILFPARVSGIGIEICQIPGGERIRSTVVSAEEPPMVASDLGGQAVRVNQSMLRKNPDLWRDVVIPGIDGRDATVIVP
jgi:hypothetical protein